MGRPLLNAMGAAVAVLRLLDQKSVAARKWHPELDRTETRN